MHTISFIGRKQNTTFNFGFNNRFPDGIEKPRLGETKGLQLSPLTTAQLKKADVVCVRLNPERISNRTLKRVLRAEQRVKPSALILNSAIHFRHYADKATCFENWEKAGLKTPKYTVHSPWVATAKLIQIVKQHLSESDGLYLRTSNEDSGKGIHYVNNNSSAKDIKRIIRQIRIRTLTNKVSESKLLMVQAVNNCDNQGVHHVYRAHVCCGTILGGYALVGKKAVIHSKDQRVEDWESFCEYNNNFSKILENAEHRAEILSAANSLGADIGAVEFFYINGELVFLELNPLWGGHHRFGSGDQFTKLLKDSSALPELKNVIAWLDAESYYLKMYTAIAEELRNPSKNS